jgi:hypothetical protein
MRKRNGREKRRKPPEIRNCSSRSDRYFCLSVIDSVGRKKSRGKDARTVVEEGKDFDHTMPVILGTVRPFSAKDMAARQGVCIAHTFTPPAQHSDFPLPQPFANRKIAV